MHRGLTWEAPLRLAHTGSNDQSAQRSARHLTVVSGHKSTVQLGAAEAVDSPAPLVDRFRVAVARHRIGRTTPPLTSGHRRVGGPVGWHGASAWPPR